MSVLARHAPHSLRARLVLWVGLIVLVVLIAFTAVSYAILDRSLSGQIDRSLSERATQVIGSVEQDHRPHTRPRQRGEIHIPPPSTFASADTFVQVATLEGELVRAPFESSSTRLPLGKSTMAAVGSGESRYQTVKMDNGSVRVYSTPLVVDEEIVGILQIGRSTDFVERALGQLRTLAALGLLVALALALLGVWKLVGGSLRPLERLTQTAESIGSFGDLSGRVTPPPTQDEVGRLAVTFNRMLSRLQASDVQLRETLETQRRFVADASHDLRTLLTTIRGNAGMLRTVT